MRDMAFTVHVPTNTPDGEQVYLLMKPFVDWWWTDETHIPMTDRGDGTWTASASVPEGAMARYTYDRWDEQEWGEPFKETRENGGGAPWIESRFLLVTPDMTTVEDTVEIWADLPFDAPRGGLTGMVVDAESGEPLMNAEVTVGGLHSATHYDGSFELEILAAGRQRLTVWRASGDYEPHTLFVDITDGRETFVPRIEMRKATPVTVTFDVLLPEGTPPEAEVKVLGTAWQLGARQSGHANYPHAPDGVVTPILERVSPDRGVATFQMYAGMYLSYFYTIGTEWDAREWPLEREGWVFRDHIVAAEDETLADDVAAWHGPGQNLVTIRLTTPPNTPPGVPVIGGGYWMTQTGDNEWVTYQEGWPTNERTFSANLGGSMFGNTMPTEFSYTIGDTDSEVHLTIERWENQPSSSIPQAGESVAVPFRVSVPSTTTEGATVRVAFDNGTTVDLSPQATNPWMYVGEVTLPAAGEYSYTVQRDDGAGAGPARTFALRYIGQAVNDWVVSWSDETAPTPVDGFVAGFYTNDWWSENNHALSSSTFGDVAAHNGSLIPVSSVWSYGHIRPVPFVEPRAVQAPCVCTPYESALEQAEAARNAGLDVFIAPQFNMEMTRGDNDLCCISEDAWWDAWVDAAELLWMWNARLAAETEADLLMLPGFLFHVYSGSGAFESEESFNAFDQRMIDLVARVRTVYDGDVLISGGIRDMELPGHADMVGVTTFDTGRPDLPATATVEEWRDGYDALFVQNVDIIWETWGKPVFFYTINPLARSDDPSISAEEVQATELEGLFQALASRPWIIGSMTWAYHMVAAPAGEDGDGLRGRLAEAVLAKYYGAYTGKQ